MLNFKARNWAVYRYCVYCVWQNQTLIYVGTTTYPNVISMTDLTANDMLREFLQADPDAIITIDFMGPYELESDAETFAKQVIETSKPYLNVHGRTLSKGTKVRIERNDGKIYPSITDAARDIETTPSVISMHLAGRKGFKTVKGYHFRRIDV
ncbi:MAG TPA: hypothetical protein PK205_07135 [Promineifilum sp.]|nr:hypothetical protein [Promineifilum sp.]